jgi:hypothetical protein
MDRVVDLFAIETRIAAMRKTVVSSLRKLADRVEAAAPDKLREVLPMVAWAIDDLERRISPWLV